MLVGGVCDGLQETKEIEKYGFSCFFCFQFANAWNIMRFRYLSKTLKEAKADKTEENEIDLFLHWPFV